eukprot:c18142_g2_i1 orf=369-884(+)
MASASAARIMTSCTQIVSGTRIEGSEIPKQLGKPHHSKSNCFEDFTNRIYCVSRKRRKPNSIQKIYSICTRHRCDLDDFPGRSFPDYGSLVSRENSKHSDMNDSDGSQERSDRNSDSVTEAVYSMTKSRSKESHSCTTWNPYSNQLQHKFEDSQLHLQWMIWSPRDSFASN